VITLTESALSKLRDRLVAKGERQSVVFTAVAADAGVSEAMHIVEEYGALCEAMYLVMVADGKVANAERAVLRGALRVLSRDLVRSRHIESMIDMAAQKLAKQGIEKRLERVIEKLRDDEGKAEVTYVLAAAVAAADNKVTVEEQDMLARLGDALGIDEKRANELLSEMGEDTKV
jgi:tellurite resistance protein